MRTDLVTVRSKETGSALLSREDDLVTLIVKGEGKEAREEKILSRAVGQGKLRGEK